MTTRTFQQQLQGFGNEPVTISASIDGAAIYSGVIDTTTDPFPSLPNDENYGVVAFEWTKDIAFAGQVTMTITHTGDSGLALVTDTWADWSCTYPVDPATGNMYVTTSGAENYVQYWYETAEDAQGEFIESDPYASVTINGYNVQQMPTRDRAGQQYYTLTPGDVITAVINIDAGYANVNPPPSAP